MFENLQMQRLSGINKYTDPAWETGTDDAIKLLELCDHALLLTPVTVERMDARYWIDAAIYYLLHKGKL